MINILGHANWLAAGSSPAMTTNSKDASLRLEIIGYIIMFTLYINEKKVSRYSKLYRAVDAYYMFMWKITEKSTTPIFYYFGIDTEGMPEMPVLFTCEVTTGRNRQVVNKLTVFGTSEMTNEVPLNKLIGKHFSQAYEEYLAKRK